MPQYILDSFIDSNRAANCNIVVTQPRRISAVAVAERVAEGMINLCSRKDGDWRTHLYFYPSA